MENTIIEFMSSSKGLSTIGLMCDMFGALLIWIYGIPTLANRDADEFLSLGNSFKEKERENHKSKVFLYDVWSGVGIFFLLLGFSIQICANLFGH